MSTKRKLARNVLFNWMSIAIGMLVPLFLAPFIVHHLGTVVYGVWILVVSITAYLNLLDFGLRGAIIRFVSKGYTQENHRDALTAISTALWLRLIIGLVIVIAGLVFAAIFPKLFTIPPDLSHAAQVALIVTALNVALTLVFGVFAAVLAALSRFDLISTVSMAQTTIRSVGMIWLLSTHHGIVSLALWDFVAALAANLALFGWCLYSYPPLRKPIFAADRAMVRKLWEYSFYVFLNTIAAQLVLYTDNLVVGAFLNAAAVTFYFIGGSMVAYSRQIVAAVSTTFTPMASSFEADGKLDHLRRLLIHGTRATLCVSLPVSIALFFRGATFIRLWMGGEYADVSGTIVKILIVNQIFAIANTTSGAIAYGMERHKPLAFWGMGVALCNLGLSIYLVRRMGLYGVAWGTVIAGLGVDLFVWPRYIAKMLNVSVGTYIWQAWSRVAIGSIPYMLACYLADTYWHASNRLIFFLQVAGTLPVFALGVVLVFWTEFSFYVRARIPWLRGKKFPNLARLD